jgi:flagellar M-ring protein FliF
VTQGPGHIRRLTAAVVVNDRVALVGPKAGQKTTNWQPRTAEELRTLTSLAQAAVGFDAVRGDLVTVQDLAFDENRTAAAVSPLGRLLSQAFDLLERSPVLVKYGTLLLGLMLLILLAIRPALRRVRSPARPTGNANGKSAELGAAAEQQALPAAVAEEQNLERQRAQQVFDQVTETLKRDPAQSSRLLQSWIHSDS